MAKGAVHQTSLPFETATVPHNVGGSGDSLSRVDHLTRSACEVADPTKRGEKATKEAGNRQLSRRYIELLERYPERSKVLL